VAINLRENPSDLAALAHLPYGRGGFWLPVQVDASLCFAFRKKIFINPLKKKAEAVIILTWHILAIRRCIAISPRGGESDE